ncbi:hypothetical protein [Clostridium sp. DJ247]|nr:hypothetical protein [Clostridium sp. DJ247]
MDYALSMQDAIGYKYPEELNLLNACRIVGTLKEQERLKDKARIGTS